MRTCEQSAGWLLERAADQLAGLAARLTEAAEACRWLAVLTRVAP